MNKFLPLIFILVSLSFSNYSQTLKPPFSTVHTLSGVKFFDRDNGIVFNPKEIWKTTNGGSNWNDISIPNAANIWKVDKRSKNRLYAYAFNSSKIYFTNNSGQDWYSHDHSPLKFYNVAFKNDTLGYAVGPNYILKTINGGNAWTKIYADTSHKYYKVRLAGNSVWVVCNDIKLKSTDEGNTWIPYSFRARGMEFANDSIGYKYNINGMSKTSDGGSTWHKLNDMFYTQQMDVVNETTIFIITAAAEDTQDDIYTIYKSTNGGKTFTVLYRSSYIHISNSIDFTSASNGYAVGKEGYMLHFINDQAIPINGEYLNDVYAIDKNKAVTVGLKGFGYKTADGGNNWTKLDIPTSEDLNKVVFANQTEGFITSNHDLYKSSNGGDVWEKIYSTDSEIRGIFFYDANLGFLLTKEKMWKTTDGGKTWYLSFLNNKGDNNSVIFFNKDLGWIGTNSCVYRTHNGGERWDSVSSGGKIIIKFITKKFGYAIENKSYSPYGKGLPMVTHNGGSSWKLAFNEHYLHPMYADFLLGFEVLDSSNFYMGFSTYGVPEPDRISTFFLRTTDKLRTYETLTGWTWSIVKASFSFSDKNHGWFLTGRYLYRVNENNNSLPVELSTFTTSVNKNKINLLWSTATETNNSGFEIERKTEGDDYRPIGFIKGKGTSSEENSYQFSDHLQSSGKYFYRLKQVDYDGSYNYSNEVEVNFSVNRFMVSQNYPNPFNPVTKIKYTIPQFNNAETEVEVELKLYDILGKEIKTLVNQKEKPGEYQVEFNGNNFPSGVYFYRITAGKYNAVKKMLLVK